MEKIPMKMVLTSEGTYDPATGKFTEKSATLDLITSNKIPTLTEPIQLGPSPDSKPPVK